MEPERDEVHALAVRMHNGYHNLPDMEKWVIDDYMTHNMESTGREPWVEILKSKPLAIVTLMKLTTRLRDWFNSFDNLWVVLLDQLIASEARDRTYVDNYPEKVMTFHILVSMGYLPTLHPDTTWNFLYLFGHTGVFVAPYTGRVGIDETVVVPSKFDDILIISDTSTMTEMLYPKYTSFIDISRISVYPDILYSPVVLDRLQFVRKFRQLVILFGIRNLSKIDQSLSAAIFGRDPVPDWKIIIDWVLSIESDGYNYRYTTSFKERSILLTNEQAPLIKDLKSLGMRILGTVIDGKFPLSGSPPLIILTPEEYRDMLFKDFGLYNTPEKQKILFFSELNALVRAENKRLSGDGSRTVSPDVGKRAKKAIVDKYSNCIAFSCTACKNETHMVDVQLALPFCSVQCRDK